MTTSDILFIGLGAMGSELAKSLATHNHTIYLHDVRSEAVNSLLTEISESRVFDAAAKAGPLPCLVFTCLPNSEDVRLVLNSQFERIQPGTLWFDCTSGDPIMDKEFVTLLKGKNAVFFDVGVSGGPRGARDGNLTAMVGCPEDLFSTATSCLRWIAKHVVWCGDSGAGHAVKAINNILMSTNLLAASEGLSVLSKYGASAKDALAAINSSSGRSWATQDRIPKYVLPGLFDYGFQLSLLRKDMLTALKLASGVGSTTPLLTQSFMINEKLSQSLSASADHTQVSKIVARQQSAEFLARVSDPRFESPSLQERGIRLVVFDCAGTTIDEKGLVYKILQQVMLSAPGGSIHFTQEEFDLWHGANKVEVLRYFGLRAGLPEELIQTMYADFLARLEGEYFSPENLNMVALVPGTLELFRALRNAGIKVCLNTGYPHSIADKLLKYLQLENEVDDIVVAEDVGVGRPYPYMIHELVRKHNVMDMRQVAKVGDTVRDVEEGRCAGCGLVVGVLTGSDSADAQLKAGADLVLQSIARLRV